MNRLLTGVRLVKWFDLPHVKNAIEKGYTSVKNGSLYTLTSGTFTHYSLESKHYYPEELDDQTNIEDIMLDNESVEFWAKSENPLIELSDRLKDFERICKDVITMLDTDTNIFGLNINSLPTQITDNFIFDFVKAWVSFYNKDLLLSPLDLELAYLHSESLVYKWRKMVELYNNINDVDGLREYLINY